MITEAHEGGTARGTVAVSLRGPREGGRVGGTVAVSLLGPRDGGKAGGTDYTGVRQNTKYKSLRVCLRTNREFLPLKKSFFSKIIFGNSFELHDDL